jgi:hypothetical protein
MFENKIIIIDNFYPEPDLVRNFALKQNYNIVSNPEGMGIPGLRTEDLKDLDDDMFRLLKRSLFVSMFGIPRYHISLEESIITNYQYCLEADGDSWVHGDSLEEGGINLSGIVFLTPNPPKNSGTIFYEINPEYAQEASNYFDEHKSFKGVNRFENKDLYEKFFIVKQVVENVYNRAVIYSGQTLHKSDFYFGDNAENARLIQPFFGSIRDIKYERIDDV